VVYSPDRRRVATTGTDGTASLWDTAQGDVICSLKPGKPVRLLAFSPDSRRVVTASGPPAGVTGPFEGRTWGGDTGQPPGAALNSDRRFSPAALRPAGRRLLTACSEEGGDRDRRRGEARVWDASTGQSIGVAIQPQLVVVHAAISPDNRRVVTGERGKARI